MNKIYKVLEGIYKDNELRRTIIPLFLGNSGIGKTKIIEQFTRDKGVNLVNFIASQRNPMEISGMALPNKTGDKMTYLDFDTLLGMKDGDILFFDEILNGNPAVLMACLTLLENREMISGRKLPNIMIVAAANKQGSAILVPQIKQRFVWYNVKFDPSMWADYMFEKYQMVDEVMTDLISLVQNETFLTSDINYFSPRSVDKAVDMIIKSVHTPYETKLLPILNKVIENTTGETIKSANGVELLPNEKISWLKLKTKINDKVNSE
jgi:hypothetical protein